MLPFTSKGQIILEQNCGVLDFPKKQRYYSKNFCPSHYNGSNKKDKGTLSCKSVITDHIPSNIIKCHYFLDLTLFRGLGRNPSNNFVAFLENLRHHIFVLRLSDL